MSLNTDKLNGLDMSPLAVVDGSGRCVGMRRNHEYLADKCAFCGKWRPGKDPDRRTCKGRPFRVSNDKLRHGGDNQ